MRNFRFGGTCAALILTLSLSAYGQPTPERGDRPSQPADEQPRPRSELGPRSESRDEGDRQPPPGKGRPRGKMESSDGAMPDGAPRGFGGGFREGGGGFGGRAGFGGGMPGGMMPGMPGFGEGFGPPDDPEMRELLKQDNDLDRKAHELAMRVRQARGDERNKLKADLQEVVNKHFDARQKRREVQLKRMEEELQRLRDAISKRNDSRESIVSNRLAELIGEPRDLDF